MSFRRCPASGALVGAPPRGAGGVATACRREVSLRGCRRRPSPVIGWWRRMETSPLGGASLRVGGGDQIICRSWGCGDTVGQGLLAWIDGGIFAFGDDGLRLDGGDEAQQPIVGWRHPVGRANGSSFGRRIFASGPVLRVKGSISSTSPHRHDNVGVGSGLQLVADGGICSFGGAASRFGGGTALAKTIEGWRRPRRGELWRRRAEGFSYGDAAVSVRLALGQVAARLHCEGRVLGRRTAEPSRLRDATDLGTPAARSPSPSRHGRPSDRIGGGTGVPPERGTRQCEPR